MTQDRANAIGKAIGTIIALVVMIVFAALVIFFLTIGVGYLSHVLWDLFLTGWDVRQ